MAVISHELNRGGSLFRFIQKNQIQKLFGRLGSFLTSLRGGDSQSFSITVTIGGLTIGGQTTIVFRATCA